MTCYRVNWVVTGDELTAMHEWLEANRDEAGVIRTIAFKGRAREGDKERKWFTKFVFKTEIGIRMFYRRWSASYTEADDNEPIAPWS